MKISNYDYSINIESDAIRGKEKGRPWNLTQIINSLCRQDKVLLDIGCATALKILPYCNKLRSVVGLDINKNLLNKANHNKNLYEINNLVLVHGSAKDLPFPDEHFDIVTVMLAPCDASEINRVLKPGGVAIVEKVGDHDKYDLKRAFGKDLHGWRGYLYSDNYLETPQQNAITAEFSKTCGEISIQNGFWETYYTKDGLIKLLEETPTVRDFDKVKDQEIINKILTASMTDDGIKVLQNRLLIQVGVPSPNRPNFRKSF